VLEAIPFLLFERRQTCKCESKTNVWQKGEVVHCRQTYIKYKSYSSTAIAKVIFTHANSEQIIGPSIAVSSASLGYIGIGAFFAAILILPMLLFQSGCGVAPPGTRSLAGTDLSGCKAIFGVYPQSGCPSRPAAEQLGVSPRCANQISVVDDQLRCEEGSSWSSFSPPTNDVPLWQWQNSLHNAAMMCEAYGAPKCDMPGMLRIDSPQTANTWSDAGFTPQEAGSWLSELPTIDPNTAKTLSAANITASQAQNYELDRQNPIDPENLVIWLNAGFSKDDMEVWHENHFSLVEAQQWRAAGFGWSDATQWRNSGFDAASATESKHEGLDPLQGANVRKLVASGYSRSIAINYAKSGVTPTHVKQFENTKRIFTKSCNNAVHNELELLTTSPYATEGVCYVITFGEVSQWLGPSSALVGGKILVMFNEPPASTFVRNLLVKGEGAFNYTSVAGALTTVPRVQVIQQLPDDYAN
jgi:hypothetical protein